jgi:hypothetical protein
MKQRNKFNFINIGVREEEDSIFKGKEKSTDNKKDSKVQDKVKTESKIFTKPDGTKILLINITSLNGTICSRSIKLCESDRLENNDSGDEKNTSNISNDNNLQSVNMDS